MCLQEIVEWFRKKPHPRRNFQQLFSCSCDLCGKNFNTMEELITHMGGHKTEDINHRLLRGYGTVRCNKCWKSFETVAYMHDHVCTSGIRDLSPIQSYDSLESVVIHS